MTTENPQMTRPEQKQPVPFGTRLKDAREALGLERKDAAAQLRLNEKTILMMEKERYPIDLPTTFIRGYIRAYAKLLQIPEQEVLKAIEPIKEKDTADKPIIRPSVSIIEPNSSTGDNYFLQLFSYAIFFALLGGAGWYYTHKLGSATPTQNLPTQLTAPIPPLEKQVTPLPVHKINEMKSGASDANESIDSETTFNKQKNAASSEENEDNDASAVDNTTDTETTSSDAE